MSGSMEPNIKRFPCTKEEDPQAWLGHLKKEMPPFYQGLFKKDKEAAEKLLRVQPVRDLNNDD